MEEAKFFYSPYPKRTNLRQSKGFFMPSRPIFRSRDKNVLPLQAADMLFAWHVRRSHEHGFEPCFRVPDSAVV